MSPTKSADLLERACRVYRIAWNTLGSASAAMEATRHSLLHSAGERASLYGTALEDILSRCPPEAAPPERRDPPAEIRAMLQRLDRTDRAAFVLREIEQLSAEETAAILRTSPQEVRSRTHRATLLLMGMIAESPLDVRGPA